MKPLGVADCAQCSQRFRKRWEYGLVCKACLDWSARTSEAFADIESREIAPGGMVAGGRYDLDRLSTIPTRRGR